MPFTELPPPSDDTMFSISVGEEAQVPTRMNPIRFAIQYRNGRTSNAWGVRAKTTGDAYIYCRDNMKEQKVSLHASGRQHISIRPRTANPVNLTGKSFMNQWHEPDEGVATFRLVFPWWGIQLDDEQRRAFKPTWDKNAILVEGHHEFLTVVSFFIVGEDATIRKGTPFPGFQLGELPLRDGKKLAVTAEWAPEQGFKAKLEDALKRILSNENMLEGHRGKTLALCMTGTWGSPNCVYMATIPVTYSPRGSAPPAHTQRHA